MPVINENQQERIVEICKSNQFYLERQSEDRIKALVQGLDFAVFTYTGTSWNLHDVIDNNKQAALKKIQNILNE